MIRREDLELRHLLFIGLFVFVILYGLYEARVVLGAFRITIDEPKNGETRTDPLLMIHGSAPRAEVVEVNTRAIPLQKDGSFEDAYLLSPGYNEITIAARNKFGKTKTEVLQIELEIR